jgi:hypothetical protein
MTYLGVAVAAVVLSLSGQTPTPTEADWDWLNSNRDAALEAVMPLRPSSGPLVVYRSYRDLYHDVVEKYFTITLVRDRNSQRQGLSATIVVPIGQSIQEQVLKAHMRNRRELTSSVISAVRIRRMTLSETDCPALRERVNVIPSLRLISHEDDGIFLHPVIHKMVVDQYGATIDVTVTDPDHPLVPWVLDTYKSLAACAAG